MDKNKSIQRNRFDIHKIKTKDCRYRKILELLKSETPGRFLEVGCGTGEFLDQVKELGFEVEGFEISDVASNKARKRGLKMKTGDVMKKLPYKKNTFDIILAGEIIEHTYDDLGFLEKFHKILKPNGKIIITTPNLLSLENRLRMFVGKDPKFVIAPTHYRTYTPKRINILFENSPFESFEVIGNYVFYTKNREPIIGTFSEWLGEKLPNISQHFIIIANKEQK